MRKNHFIINLLVSVIIVITGGCSKDSSVDPVETTYLSVLVTYENGDPIEGAAVTTYPETQALTTDSEGKVVFESLTNRSYNVIVSNSGSPEFNQYVNLTTTSEADLHFIILSQLTIKIKDDQERPISAATLTTIPSTQEVKSDDAGTAVLKNVPVQSYLFTVTPQNLSPVKRNIVLDETTGNSIDFAITSQAPEVEITEPADDTVRTPFENVLKGAATDNEDGDLPDSAYIWSSSIDGKIGTGKEIIVSELSIGNHNITLTCTDSDGKSTSARITLIIVDYDPDSYFPILENATWEYRHATPNFYVITSDNVSEYWEIYDMIITIDDQLRRTSTVYFDITIGVVVSHYKYTLIDYIETDENAVYVTKTTESMIQWQGNDESEPFFKLNGVTTYTPSFLILKNVTDLFTEPEYKHTVRTSTEWWYTYYNTTSSVFRESINLETTITAGAIKNVQTDKGYIKAVEIIISSSADETKTWWLTKGLGLVRFDYMLSDSEQTVIMTDADMFDFYRATDNEKIAGKTALYSSPQIIRNVNYSKESGERLMDLRNFLKSMIPY